MTAKMADIETLLCPICHNEIRRELLEKLKLNLRDLSTIEDLVNENILMQIVELGKLASKYFKPETLTTEIQVKDSLGILSDKARELMEKHRELSDKLVNASEEKKIKITAEAMQEQGKLVAEFQSEIKKLNEQQTKAELERKQELEKMNVSLQEIQKKILGVGIGEVRELSIIRDLQSACRDDEFSDEKASKHGADVIGKVKMKGNEIGSIVISVKEHEYWKGDFIDQIKKNLKEEQTDWGILATKVFPTNALNGKMYVDGSGILVVKTEYVAAAYLGLRHAVIHKHQAQALIRNQQERANMHEQILGVLTEWVQGDKLKAIFAKMDDAKNATLQTEDLMQKLQAYNERTIKSTRDLQGKIRGYLQESNEVLGELQERLPVI